MSEVRLPVLLTGDVVRDAIGDPSIKGPLDSSIIEKILKSSPESPESNGIHQLVKLLLTEPAVAVHFLEYSTSEGEDNAACKWKIQIGFNDHGGGTESPYKILLNIPNEEGQLTQYVLISPPSNERPVNTTFYEADFVNPDLTASKPRYLNSVPNASKTNETAWNLKGKDYYKYYLLGGPETLQALRELLIDIGFGFKETPYSTEMVNNYNAIVGEAKAASNSPEWPGMQFAGQVALLGLRTL